MKTDLNVQWTTYKLSRAGQVERLERTGMQHFSSHAVLSRFSLTDSGCQSHCQLDWLFGSLDEAIADAIAWVEPLADTNKAAHLIGVDVATGNGDWRTCRLPGPLLCPLPH